MARDTSHRRRLELRGSVLPETAQPLLVSIQRQAQVELGGSDTGSGRRQGQTGELQLALGGVLEGEEHVEERRRSHLLAGRRPLGGQFANQPLQWHTLMGETGQGVLFDLLQEALERPGAGRHFTAHRQGVDEEADQPLQLAPLTTGDGRAHHQVGLTAVAFEQHNESGQRHHEEGGVAPLGQPLQPREEGAAQIDR